MLSAYYLQDKYYLFIPLFLNVVTIHKTVIFINCIYFSDDTDDYILMTSAQTW